MKRMSACALLLLAACGGGGTGSNPTNVPATGPLSAGRSYNASASVGDFLTVTVDPSAETISYSNKTNGDFGTIPFTINSSDGSYSLNDPAGNFTTAYEIPGFGMVLAAQRAGPNHNATALVTAVATAPISLRSWADNSYNVVQFRTNSGGVMAGSESIDAQGNAQLSAYWPFSSTLTNGTGFINATIGAARVMPDASGTYLTISDAGGASDTLFGTSSGIFALDSPAGAMIGVPKAASKTFDASVAGTYHGLSYQKSNASITGSSEAGSVILGKAAFIVDTSGTATLKDPTGNTVFSGALTPVADAAYLQGFGKLSDPCNGLFTFRATNGSGTQDVFVTFQAHAAIFWSFVAPATAHQGGTYSYLYGIALR